MLQARAWLPRSEGSLRLAFQRREERTALDVLHQAGVLRARFPKPEAQEAPEAVLVNTAGGLTGGDKLDIGVKLGEGTSLTVTSAAAEKIYRARDGRGRHSRAPRSGSRCAACLAAAADHPVRRRALRSPHRGRPCGRRAFPRRRDADLRPGGDGRGRASRVLPRRVARAPRGPAGVRGQPAARWRHRRNPRPSGCPGWCAGDGAGAVLRARMRRLASSRRVRYWKGRGAPSA